MQVDVQLAALPPLLGSMLAELVTLAGECDTVATARHHTGPGFLSPEAKNAMNEQHRKERHARYFNQLMGVEAPGWAPTPMNIAAVSIAAEIDRFLIDIVDDLHRRLARARLCLISEPWRGFRDQRLTRDQAGRYAADLLSVYTRPAELRRIHAEGENLAARARRFLDGAQTVAHDQPCPWCGHMTLVAHLTAGVIRCESDRHTGRRLPCVCPDQYCACKTSPVGHRHEWHRDVLKADPAPGETKHRLHSQTWHGLKGLFRDRARTSTSTTNTEE
ncbi:hypothetical protein GCM10009737_07960 [Nocardioides lentus]|uniref:DUF222 domain-containing protein n=1 Tax=Nocardioides lentus TaxID=338077 RepID=A0ABN2P1B1_9ACTN